MSYMQKGISTATKPIVVGGLAYLASMVIMSNTPDILRLPVIGSMVSVHTYMGLVGVLSSFFTETVSNWILPYIPMNKSYASYEGAILGPSVNGGLNIALTYFIYPSLFRSVGATKLFGTGLVAELGGDYIYNNFINPNIKY